MEQASFMLLLLFSLASCPAVVEPAMYSCVVVAGTPEFSPAPATAATTCALMCSVSAACSTFVFNTSSPDTPCQLAWSEPLGSAPTPLFVSSAANVTLVLGFSTSPECEISSSPPQDSTQSSASSSSTDSSTSGSSTTVSSTSVSPTDSTTWGTTSAMTTEGNYSYVEDDGSYNDCWGACLSVGLVMLPCPENQTALDDLSDAIGKDTKYYLDGLRQEGAVDFYDHNGRVAIPRNSPMWSDGSPNENPSLKAVLTSHWAKIGDTILDYVESDVKKCVCVDKNYMQYG